MKRTLSLVLIALMLILQLGACSGAPADQEKDLSNETTAAVETEPETVAGMERANLPEKNYDGEEIVFLGGANDSSGYAWRFIDSAEQTGEVLNDAIYVRNRKVEATYGVKISAILPENSSDTKVITNSINASDSSFDAIVWRIDQLMPLARDNFLVDYGDMTYIDTSASWWDQSLVEGLTLFDQLYFCTGDISPWTDARVNSIVFNKDMCRELGLELPYQSVFDGTWTIEKFNTYISNVNSDINGDSKMDYDDRWGFFSQNGCGWMVYFSGGGRITDTVGDEPVISFSSERNVTLANMALSISTDKSKTLMADPYVNSNGGWPAASAWFANGGSLMRSSVFEPVPRDYRSMETDFGVLPFPKLDENQDRYYTLPEYATPVISFPTTCDRESVSLIVEAMAAESTYTVTEAFYENCLNEKSVRDEESKQILKIIFDSKIFDIGYFLNLGDFRGQLNKLEGAGTTDVASTFEKINKTAQKALEKLIEDYIKLAEAK